MKKQKQELLKLADLAFDQINELYYPRLAIDYQVVENYVRKMEAGETFPNIKIGRLRNVTKNIVIDGRHTIEALKKRKVDYYTCDIYTYESEKELFADAVRFNARHGRALSQADEELIISRLQEYNFSVEEIQKIVHVSASEIKRESFNDEKTNSFTVTGPGGKKTTVKVKEVKAQEVKPELPTSNPTISLAQIESRNNEVLHIIEFRNNMKRVVNYLETNRLPTDAESRELMRKLRSLMIIEVD